MISPTRAPRRWLRALAAGAAGALACASLAAPPEALPEVEVAGHAELGGDSASEGSVSGRALDSIPIERPGDVLEAIPGVVVTQHSGGGKANQYFLRGFNLDHGTDFRVTVGGMLVNSPTHAHGQGYADLNFLIPEIVSRIGYAKGPYRAQDGDFATAGSATIDYVWRLPQTLAEITVGQNRYGRLLLAGSPEVGGGNLLYALDLGYNDGPWDNPENFRKFSGVLRYSQGQPGNGWAVTAMAYRANWDSTDQIPVRAVQNGSLCRFCAVDASDGGSTERYSLSWDWARSSDTGVTRANAYLLDSRLSLFSNFTYYLNDPVKGDQFEQSEKRLVGGVNLSHTWLGKWGGREMENTLGAQFLDNRIRPVGLYATASRQRLSVTRQDNVNQFQAGVYGENRVQWLPWLRSVAGLRYDTINYDVTSDQPANSGRGKDGLWSPKLSFVAGPWQSAELYANYGWGFHSNDVRGATITVDPVSGNPADHVPALVRAKGGEVGARYAPGRQFETALALWRLKLDSELVFVGDAGTTEAGAASTRQGVEWSAHWRATNWLSLATDFAWTRARFDNNPAGDRIPGAVETVATVYATVDNLQGWFGGLYWNFFGPRPLTEDNSVRSASSSLFNARVGHKIDKRVSAWVDVFNLFNKQASDIEYYYCSRLKPEAAGTCADGGTGIDGVHFHPAIPRTVRLTVKAAF